MPLVKEIHIKKGLLLLWEITEKPDQLQKHYPVLTSDKRYKAFKHKKRQIEWLAIRLMLIHIGFENVNIRYNDHGQPYITHPHYKHISISHSDTLAGIILHEEVKVGLDIESFDRNFIQVERKYLSPVELEMTQQEEKWHCLFWCAKEAVFKTAGQPGIHFTDQIAINSINPGSINAKLKTNKHEKSYRLNYFEYQRHFIVYAIDRKY
ncbi:MAG TPA: 4'-phosphopantetheinyl transferase superfamily protein [Sunxiuqinia sp.]|nr:4'-phosphopantetheinyl transferase superfamily protein [Sunxiuqinia sp.]